MSDKNCSPWRTVKKQYMENGKPTDTEERFLELLQVLSHTSQDNLVPMEHRKMGFFKPLSRVIRKINLLCLQPLAESASKIYPGWRMRIYHNITEDDQMVQNSQPSLAQSHFPNTCRPSPHFANFTVSTTLSTCVMCVNFQSLETSTPSSLLGDFGDSRF